MCKTCLESIKTDLVAVGNVGLMSEDSQDDEAAYGSLNGLLDNYPDDDYFEDKWGER